MTTSKDKNDTDVHSVLIHNDEVMTMIGKLQTVMGIGWDHTVYSIQEILDMFIERMTQ